MTFLNSDSIARVIAAQKFNRLVFIMSVLSMILIPSLFSVFWIRVGSRPGPVWGTVNLLTVCVTVFTAVQAFRKRNQAFPEIDHRIGFKIAICALIVMTSVLLVGVGVLATYPFPAHLHRIHRTF